MLTVCLIPQPPPSGGQCHVPDPGRKEPDEHCGVHCEGLLRCLHQVPEVPGHAVTQHAGHLLEDEGPREEASGEEGEAGRRLQQQSQEGLPQEARQPSAGPERVQGHG